MELTRRKLFKSATVASLVAHDLLSHGFKTALCKESPDSWHEKVTQYGADYMRLGAATLRDRLSSDLIVLQRQVGNTELWDVTAKLMTLFGKTIPGNEGLQALEWYQMAAEASDRSDSLETRIWVRGRAAIAFGYEGAALVEAKRFADEALQLGERRSKPTLGELNAVMGRAHVAALEGDYRHAKVLQERGQRIFDKVGSTEQESDFAIPEWRMAVYSSLLFARLGDSRDCLRAQETARQNLPESLPRFATHLDLHTGLLIAQTGDSEAALEEARIALERLPPEKHSLTLKLLQKEIATAARVESGFI